MKLSRTVAVASRMIFCDSSYFFLSFHFPLSWLVFSIGWKAGCLCVTVFSTGKAGGLCVTVFSTRWKAGGLCVTVFSIEWKGRWFVCDHFLQRLNGRQCGTSISVWQFFPLVEKQVVSVLLFSPQADRQMVWGCRWWWWLVHATGSGLLSLLSDCCTAVLKVWKACRWMFYLCDSLQFKKQIMGWVKGGWQGTHAVRLHSTGCRVGCGV